MLPSLFSYIFLSIVFIALALFLLKVRPFYTYFGRIIIDIMWIGYGALTGHHVVMAIFILSLINSITKRPEFQAHDPLRT